MGKQIDFTCHSCNMQWCVDIEPNYPEDRMPDEYREVDVDFDECPNCSSERVVKE